MALPGFQRALADLVASPEACCEALAHPQRVAQRYQLTGLELRRLQHCARHRGIKVCWALHRANRLGPVYAVLPLTCVALGPRLRTELEAFWSAALPRDLQFKTEGERFAAFLLRRRRDGALCLPVLDDLVPFELAVAELRFQPRRPVLETLARASDAPDATWVMHPFLRLLRFSHDPERLLEALTQDRPVPAALARGEYDVLVDATGEGLAVRLLDPRLARLLESLKSDLEIDATPADIDALREAGLIARWPRTLAVSHVRDNVVAEF
jgi:hypothetical protein